MEELTSGYVYMQPNKTIERVWDFTGGIEEVTLYVLINCKYGDSRVGEPIPGVPDQAELLVNLWKYCHHDVYFW